jgi:hypothetical protein
MSWPTKLVTTVGILLLAAFLGGCGGSDLLVGSATGNPTPVTTATPTCGDSGTYCTQNSDCCSGRCDLIFGCA